MERRLAAVLAADVVGYTRLIRDNEDATLAALLRVMGVVAEANWPAAFGVHYAPTSATNFPPAISMSQNVLHSAIRRRRSNYAMFLDALGTVWNYD